MKLAKFFTALLCLLLLLCNTFSVSAFNYNITFTASGASTTIDYIKVQNITQGTTVTVSAGSSLEVTAIKEISAIDESIRIYPNPIKNGSRVLY